LLREELTKQQGEFMRRQTNAKADMKAYEVECEDRLLKEEAQIKQKLVIDREKVQKIHKEAREHTIRNKEHKDKIEDSRKNEELEYVIRVKQEIADGHRQEKQKKVDYFNRME